MCEDCARDYADPANRRFHAEPIACPRCGPRLSHPIAQVAAAIAARRNRRAEGHRRLPSAVRRARRSRGRRPCAGARARDAKPFAVMVANSASAERLAEIGLAERALLAASRAADRACAKPGPRSLRASRRVSRDVGLMLAYTPLHWLVLHALAGCPGLSRAGATRPSDLALVADQRQPRRRAAGRLRRGRGTSASRGVADLIVTHERAIVVRADDSVVRVRRRRARLSPARARFRSGSDRSRLGRPCVIAAGADLKNTVTITRGREAFVSQHIGDLDNRETIRFREETIRHLTSILDVEPEVRGLRPASGFRLDALCGSVAACRSSRCSIMSPTSRRSPPKSAGADPILGVALDGHGLGTDGRAVGRRAHRPRRRALGAASDRSSRWRCRAATGRRASRGAWAWRCSSGSAGSTPRRVCFAGLPEAARLAGRARRGAPRRPTTTSLGPPVRRRRGAARASASSRLRRTGGDGAGGAGRHAASCRRRLARSRADGSTSRPLMGVDARRRGFTGREAAEAFHGTLIAGLAEWIGAAAAARGLMRVALGGGCLMNRVLAEGLVAAAASAAGLDPALPRAGPRQRRRRVVRPGRVCAGSRARRRWLSCAVRQRGDCRAYEACPRRMTWRCASRFPLRCAKCCRTTWPRSASTA